MGLMSDNSSAAGCLSRLPEKQPNFRNGQHNCAAREPRVSGDMTCRRSWRLSRSKPSSEPTAAFGNERRRIEQTFDYVGSQPAAGRLSTSQRVTSTRNLDVRPRLG